MAPKYVCTMHTKVFTLRKCTHVHMVSINFCFLQKQELSHSEDESCSQSGFWHFTPYQNSLVQSFGV